jgi:hypothetical protein
MRSPATFDTEKSSSFDTMLKRLRAICLALPGTFEEAAWIGTRWVVRDKNFAHLVPIAGGKPDAYAMASGETDCNVLTIRVADEMFEAVSTAGPRYFAAVWGTTWGDKVAGIKLDERDDLGDLDWDRVKWLIEASYQLFAPKKKAAKKPAPKKKKAAKKPTPKKTSGAKTRSGAKPKIVVARATQKARAKRSSRAKKRAT